MEYEENKKEDSPFYFKHALKAPEQWETSSESNGQLAAALACSKRFHLDIEKIRNEFQIPKLKNINDVNDWFDFDLPGVNENGSLINENNKRLFLKKVIEVLSAYKLPLNFFYWVLDWIFYNKEPGWKPLYNYIAYEELEGQIATKLTLDTKEKRWLKRILRNPQIKKLAMKGLSKEYHRIIAAIDVVKNPRRRIKNPEKILKIAIEMQKRTPKKTKIYIKGSYLEILKKNGYSNKEIKRLEELNGESVKIIPRYTTKRVAQKIGISKKKDKEAYLRKKYERFEKRLKPPGKLVN